VLALRDEPDIDGILIERCPIDGASKLHPTNKIAKIARAAETLFKSRFFITASYLTIVMVTPPTVGVATGADDWISVGERPLAVPQSGTPDCMTVGAIIPVSTR
jgi:hypothetical protein